MQEAVAQQAEDQLTAALNMFKCSKDADIETFLHTKAILFHIITQIYWNQSRS